MKPFKFHESRNASKQCLTRSLSTPQLKNLDDSDAESGSMFKAKQFPKKLFCNYYHFKLWEDNYFRQEKHNIYMANYEIFFFLSISRALNKKLRAEEMCKLSKLPPSMARREKSNVNKYEDLNYNTMMRPNNDVANKKKKFKKRSRKLKTSSAGTQVGKFSVRETKRDREKAKVSKIFL
jgi:protein FAM161A